MEGVRFKDMTGMLGKPGNMSDDECNSLPVKETTYLGKYRKVESVWEMTQQEYEELGKTRRIRLGVISPVQPPVILEIEKPE